MNNKNPLLYIIFVILIVIINCSSTEEFQVLHQVTGCNNTNCYLIHGIKSKEAALIDVGGPIDTLLTYIKENNLDLKYFFFTHGHFDHVMGLPEIRDQFPEAKVCIHKDEYADMFIQLDWMLNNMGQEFLNKMKNDPKLSKLFEFDPATFGTPDILIDDNQIFKLGYSNITALHTPGHSPGSMCYHIGNSLFSASVLFYRSVGNTDLLNGSREDQIKSVRRLYSLFTDETKVYPGHGQFTDIGIEKRENKRITADKVTW